MTNKLLREQYKEEEGDNAYSNFQFGHFLHVEKFCTFVFTLFVLLSIILNYFLTKNFGLIGTAVGSVVAIVLFNLIRFIYIKKLLQLQPFSTNNLWAILIAVGWGLISYLIPLDNALFLSHVLKSILFISGFSFTIVRMNLSPDITDLFQQVKNKFFHSS